MINTWDENRNHLCNPQGHESPKHTAQVLTRINIHSNNNRQITETKGHTYTSTNQWELGTGVRDERSGGLRDSYEGQPSGWRVGLVTEKLQV
jgi:hypothetical protein